METNIPDEVPFMYKIQSGSADNDFKAQWADPEDLMPHYALPNVASGLQEFTNAEQDTIRQVFHPGNYTHMNVLPNDLKPNAVNRQRNMLSELAKTSFQGYQVSHKPFVPTKGSYPLFQQFEYIPSRYTLADDLARDEAAASVAKHVGPQPFLPAGLAPIPPTPASPLYQPTAVPDPYESADNDVLREKWLHKALCQDITASARFLPSGARPDWDKPSRAMLPDILAALRKHLTHDWSQHDLDIQAEADDTISIKFLQADIDSQAGLLAYMNVFSKAVLVNSYGLRRCVERWHVLSADGLFLCYHLSPPWRSTNPLHTFYTLDPHARFPVKSS